MGPPGKSSAGLGGVVPPEVTETWIHYELAPSKDRTDPDQLAADLRHVLDDVRVAVEDQQRMDEVARRLADGLTAEGGGAARADNPPMPPREDEAEYGELLRWLADGNFLFLGYREYDLVPVETGVALRPVPGSGLGILRHRRPGQQSLSKLSSQILARAQDPAERLVLAKANSRSTVYRANYLDYVSVKKHDAAGKVTGEFRFLGLYTHSAHTAPVASIPMLRGKLAYVLAVAGLTRDGHDGKDLIEILEDYPREELFEISAEELTPIALGVLRLSERKQTRLFLPGPVWPVHVVPGLPAPGAVHDQGQAAGPGHPPGGPARGIGGLQRPGRRLGPGPAARGDQG